MQVADGLYIEWVGDEAVALNPENGQLHYLNPPAALAYALIQEYGYEKGIDELRKAHGDAPNFESDLAALVDELLERGLLADDG